MSPINENEKRCAEILELIEQDRVDTKATVTDQTYIVYDLDDVQMKIDTWRQRLPTVTPFYAVKCNDDIILLEKMVKAGLSFDCASIAEIEKILSLEVSPDKIIYANPCKQVSKLQKAVEYGVTLTTFDSLEELRKIEKHAPDMNVLLRLATDDSKSVCTMSQKYGAQPNEILPILERMQKSTVTLKGFSFHVGSGCEDPDAFPNAIQRVKNAFTLAKKMGFSPSIVDVGGGFPGRPFDADTGGRPSFFEMAKNLNKALEKHFGDEEGVKFIGEPGRYMVSSAGTLITSVIGKKVINKSDEDSAHTLYYLSEGVYGALSNVIFDHAMVEPIPLETKGMVDTTKQTESSLWGPTCDGFDCVMKRVTLPRMKVGALVMFNNMGAYTAAAVTNFNGFEDPKVFVIEKNKAEQVS